MSEHPILFSAPMVRAILDGRKTQTRRIVKRQPPPNCYLDMNGNGDKALMWDRGEIREDGQPLYIPIHGATTSHLQKCPCGQAGDTLWVRESFRTIAWVSDPLSLAGTRPSGLRCAIEYVADEEIGPCHYPDDENYQRIRSMIKCFKDEERIRPSIHMPRWASRITLRITDVRVERLQDISEEDAKAEGCTDGGCGNCGNSSWPEPCGCPSPDPLHSDAFAWLWQSINGHDSWHANPWIWVVEFERVSNQQEQVSEQN